ncbi:MAG: DNA translocase FtsK [Christensenellales bacterium]
MLAKAIELAVDAGQVSISMLQRRLRVGYARAGRLVDEMTQRGITAEAEARRSREPCSFPRGMAAHAGKSGVKANNSSGAAKLRLKEQTRKEIRL